MAVAVVGGGMVAGGQLAASVAPPRLLVDGVVGHGPEPADDPPVHVDQRRRQDGAGGFVHERHELVRDPGHGAGDADPAHVGTAADPVDPAALGYVALDHGTPAAQLDQALRRAVLVREIALLVVAAAVAALVDGRAEQPGR